MKRAFLKQTFKSKRICNASSMRQLLKNFNRMKFIFSALVIVAFAVTICFSNFTCKREKRLVFGGPPIIVIPPIMSIQTATTFYQDKMYRNS
jgi:hypothetical protein